jgi:hypothetical protein
VTNAYDSASDNWTVGASMPTIRYNSGAAVVNDTFYVIGGRSGQWGYFVDMRADASNEQYIPFGYGTLSPKPKPEPFPTTLAITVSGASLAAIAVGVLVYFKKRKH